MKQSKLTIAIFMALFLGIFTGWLFPDFAVKLHVLAEIFLRMVKMIIAPLLFATLVVGIAGHGDVKSIGRLGIKTIAYFEVVTTIALFIGLGFANLFKPGEGMGNISTVHNGLNSIVQSAATTHHNSFGELFHEVYGVTDEIEKIKKPNKIKKLTAPISNKLLNIVKNYVNK